MKRLFAFFLTSTAFVGSFANAANIVEEWASVKPPPPPALKSITVDPKTTALLMLDFMKPNCGSRPRCMATIPAIKKLLHNSRAAKVAVVYTFTAKTTAADIVDKDLAPLPGEPSVTSFVDKFINTELEKILKDKGIKTVIAVGTAANGAVVYTASSAALKGFDVLVPVDGISSIDAYPEQITVWLLANGLGVIGERVKLTRSDMIKF